MYGYIASMKTKPGRREQVVSILLNGTGHLRRHGCELYVVSTSETDEDTIWITEAWKSREHHAAALELPETRKAISEAIPLLTGESTRQETTVAGGLGIQADLYRFAGRSDGSRVGEDETAAEIRELREQHGADATGGNG